MPVTFRCAPASGYVRELWPPYRGYVAIAIYVCKTKSDTDVIIHRNYAHNDK